MNAKALFLERGMSDRDTFAAAALTGLLAGRKFTELNDAIVAEAYAESAYGLADAMLRERGDTKPMPKEKRAVVSEQEPVAWAVIGKEQAAGHVIGLHDTVLEARARVGRMVSYGDIYTADKVEIVPLYRQPQPTLTGEEREAVLTAIDGYEAWEDDNCRLGLPETQATIAMLRKLLERMK